MRRPDGDRPEVCGCRPPTTRGPSRGSPPRCVTPTLRTAGAGAGPVTAGSPRSPSHDAFPPERNRGRGSDDVAAALAPDAESLAAPRVIARLLARDPIPVR